MLNRLHSLARLLASCTLFVVVYFLQAGSEGFIKIGFTSGRSKNRQRCCQTYHHETIDLLVETPGTIQDETALHRMFDKYNVRGEWFRPVPEILDVIRAIQDGVRLRDILDCAQESQ